MDWTKKYKGQSKLVVRPKSTEEVSAVLKYCNDRKLAVEKCVVDLILCLWVYLKAGTLGWSVAPNQFSMKSSCHYPE
jgi:hypothetical protein